MLSLNSLLKVIQIGHGARPWTQVCLYLGAELVPSVPYYLTAKCSKQKQNKQSQKDIVLTLSDALRHRTESGWERSEGARSAGEGSLEKEFRNWVLTDGFGFGMVKWMARTSTWASGRRVPGAWVGGGKGRGGAGCKGASQQVRGDSRSWVGLQGRMFVSGLA